GGAPPRQVSRLRMAAVAGGAAGATEWEPIHVKYQLPVVRTKDGTGAGGLFYRLVLPPEYPDTALARRLRSRPGGGNLAFVHLRFASAALDPGLRMALERDW